MNERKKYIEMHESRIWQSTDGKWYTYLPDINKKRKLIKRKSEDEILNEIVKYYKNVDDEQTVEQVIEQKVDEIIDERLDAKLDERIKGSTDEEVQNFFT